MTTDPYKYFRVEARELLEGLTEGALQLERGAADRAMVGSLLRLAHTLKGASRVVRQPEMADLAHGVEEILSPFRDADAAIPGNLAHPMLQLLDQIGTRLAVIDHPSTPPGSPKQKPSPEEPLETVRVDVEEVEGVLSCLSEASVHLRKVQNEFADLEQARRQAGQLIHLIERSNHEPRVDLIADIGRLATEISGSTERLFRRLGAGLEGVQREFGLTRERADRLRLLSPKSILPSLQRAVRDAAVTMGKQANLVAVGCDIRLDAHVLLTVRDALAQLVRNAVAHGLEEPGGRAAAGKPPCGRVEIMLERRGNRIAFICRDDGRGIDVAAIRRVAVKKGLVAAARSESLGVREMIGLILQGGVTTAAEATGISGRGIGLDLVSEVARRLKGQVSIETVPGQGTTVEICVPVSLTSVPAVLLQSDDIDVSLPLDNVRETVRIPASGIVRSGTGEFLTWQGRTLPFVPLARLLHRSGRQRRGHWCAVIVTSGPDLVAVGVDRLIGIETVTVRSIPSLAAPAAVIAGATLDDEGNPQLVLEPAALVHAVANAPLDSAAATLARPLVLVIDDSLTTRMVEQTILESAGYDVEVAQSGEEAMEKAAARAYDLFLVDVEMPGMDGFEFVTRTRRDPVLRKTPALLVTSRNSPEDRLRGKNAGASAYIVKSEFHQSHFLRTIQRLVRS